MAEICNSYETKVGMERGGNKFFLKEAGEFKFFDTDYSGATLRNFFRSNYTITTHGMSNDSLFSGPVGSVSPFLTPCYGYHALFLNAGCSKASCELLSGSLGDILWVDAHGCESNFSLTFIFSAEANQISIFTNRGSRISTAYMTMAGLSAGTASIGTPRVKMICTADNKWYIASATTGVTIQAE